MTYARQNADFERLKSPTFCRFLILIRYICAGNPDLEFSAYETLFDNGGNQNIVVEKVSNNQLRFKLLDYGAYCIKVWPVGFEDRASKIIIEKYSRPSYEVSDTEWLEDSG